MRDYPRHVPLVHTAAQQVQHGVDARLPGADHDVVVGLRRRQRVDGLDRCVPSVDWKRRWAHRRHHYARLWRDQLAIRDGAPPAAGVDEGGRLRVVGSRWEEAHAARRNELGHHAIVVLEHGGEVVGDCNVPHFAPDPELRDNDKETQLCPASCVVRWSPAS
eukprot:scaffold35890_cov65-Phaeocystis_antarctica.AAC.4